MTHAIGVTMIAWPRKECVSPNDLHQKFSEHFVSTSARNGTSLIPKVEFTHYGTVQYRK